MTDLHVGDIVRRKDRKPLYSGAAVYAQQVVIRVNPLALASFDGNMLWHNTVSAEDFDCIGTAPDHTLNKGLRRLLDLPTASKGANVLERINMPWEPINVGPEERIFAAITVHGTCGICGWNGPLLHVGTARGSAQSVELCISCISAALEKQRQGAPLKQRLVLRVFGGDLLLEVTYKLDERKSPEIVSIRDLAHDRDITELITAIELGRVRLELGEKLKEEQDPR